MTARGTSPPGPGTPVGRRLRQLREERGLTLSELARAAGVGKATVSGLENGTRDPRLETLYAIAAVLRVPLSALTLDRGAPASAASTVRGDAVVSTLLHVFEEPAATYELLLLRIVAGVEQVSPAHPAGVTEHLTVFRGQARVGPVGQPMVVGPGGHISWAADTPHLFAAVGPDDVEASLLIRTPR
jgi:transcriptional regulator with XRE-family HTH domain